MKNDIKHILLSLKNVFTYVLGFKEGTDIPATIAGIKKDIGFAGHTAWILMFSIFIASIGLNVNSTAVIIGAMLISPLMGPILGVGLSVATNDYDTLLRSLKNIGIAIFISLFTSTLYFLITPLDIAQSELIARTKPTILDVLVALLGGFAGIIAGSRKEKGNVVSGVAIATALMPPLCTAGYGLAHLNWEYFLGAFYLFFINSIFISLATFIIVRYLKFPLVEYVNKEKLKRYKIMLISFLIIILIPSTVIFYYVIQETRFKVKTEDFVAAECSMEGSELLNYKLTYNDTLSVIDLYYMGAEINAPKIAQLEANLRRYELTKGNWIPITDAVIIKVHQEGGKDFNFDEKLSELNNTLRMKILEDIYTKNEELVQGKDQKIKLLEDRIMTLSKQDTIPFLQLSKEMKYKIPTFEKFAYSKLIEVTTSTDSFYYDTIPVFLVKLASKQKSSSKKSTLAKAESWLQIRLSDEKIKVLEY